MNLIKVRRASDFHYRGLLGAAEAFCKKFRKRGWGFHSGKGFASARQTGYYQTILGKI
ncbi:MAG: hypothetical protein ABIK89_01820 [Planctomycetota bacterium]